MSRSKAHARRQDRHGVGRYGINRHASLRRLALASAPLVIEPMLTPMEQFAEDWDVADMLIDYVDWDWDESYFDTPPLRVPLIEASTIRVKQAKKLRSRHSLELDVKW